VLRPLFLLSAAEWELTEREQDTGCGATGALRHRPSQSRAPDVTTLAPKVLRGVVGAAELVCSPQNRSVRSRTGCPPRTTWPSRVSTGPGTPGPTGPTSFTIGGAGPPRLPTHRPHASGAAATHPDHPHRHPIPQPPHTGRATAMNRDSLAWQYPTHSIGNDAPQTPNKGRSVRPSLYLLPYPKRPCNRPKAA
jgi:hypothetical protein